MWRANFIGIAPRHARRYLKVSANIPSRSRDQCHDSVTSEEQGDQDLLEVPSGFAWTPQARCEGRIMTYAVPPGTASTVATC